MPAAACASTAACNVSGEQPSDRPADPGVVSNVRRFGWVALAATDWVRRKEPFHAFDASGGCRQVRWSIYHTASDPLCAGRHPDLVAHAIVADRGTSGVAAVAVVVARERRIVAARVADTVMNGVVPVVIVIGVLSVPATVVRFQRVMRPANTGIRASNDNILSGVIPVPRPAVRGCN